jgi:cystathionine beta-lyase
LPGSPGHAHWRSLCTTDGAACLLSVVLDTRFSQAQVDAFVDALRLFRLAYSWAGPISLVVPYDLARSRARWPARVARGTVVRFAVGLEDPQDLQADIAQALALLRT